MIAPGRMRAAAAGARALVVTASRRKRRLWWWAIYWMVTHWSGLAIGFAFYGLICFLAIPKDVLLRHRCRRDRRLGKRGPAWSVARFTGEAREDPQVWKN